MQFNARITKPDPRFAALLLEQFGGGNGELKAAMQYFVQAFSARMPHPQIYDLLMDIATEEFSHLEIVGATITMLTGGIQGELKNAVETNPVAQRHRVPEHTETILFIKLSKTLNSLFKREEALQLRMHPVYRGAVHM